MFIVKKINFIINFEQISFTPCFSVSSVEFEQVNNHWQIISLESPTKFRTESHLRVCKGLIGV